MTDCKANNCSLLKSSITKKGDQYRAAKSEIDLGVDKADVTDVRLLPFPLQSLPSIPERLSVVVVRLSLAVADRRLA